jgi:phosphoenolpyruvate carboxylase|tara:strand:- start:9524 stop:9961 length:438 start_codon:yes stop_codon:yes gene_type:complete
MSHSYAGFYGYGVATTSMDDIHCRGNLTEPTHIRLHSYMGGDRNGNRCTIMSIGKGHSYETFSDADVSIHMTKKDVARLVKELSAWLEGDEGSDDYGTMPEIKFNHKSHPDNHFSEEEYRKVLEERGRTFGWTDSMVENHLRYKF